MKIASLTLANNVILAPMAGVTDLPFRQLAVEMGCGLVYTEMVSAKGAVCAPHQTLKIARLSDKERPAGIQLFGSDPGFFAQAAEICKGLGPDLFDINMGCPVRKVAGKGEGCGLMRNLDLAAAIVKAVVGVASVPVTVKMRKGWDEQHVNAVELALCVEQAGAAAVTVHGRTRAQGYSGRADWGIIRQVKEALRIPVIGNGDIWCPEDAKRLLHETGCDGVMIGRGVLGNPWLIRRTVHYLETGELQPELGLAEKLRLARRHLAMVVQHKGEHTGVREMRKHLAWYFKGIPGAASVRNRVMQAKTEKEMAIIIAELARE